MTQTYTGEIFIITATLPNGTKPVNIMEIDEHGVRLQYYEWAGVTLPNKSLTVEQHRGRSRLKCSLTPGGPVQKEQPVTPVTSLPSQIKGVMAQPGRVSNRHASTDSMQQVKMIVLTFCPCSTRNAIPIGPVSWHCGRERALYAGPRQTLCRPSSCTCSRPIDPASCPMIDRQ